MKTTSLLFIAATSAGLSMLQPAIAAIAAIAASPPVVFVVRAAQYEQSSASASVLAASHPYVFSANGVEIPQGVYGSMSTTLPNTGLYEIPPNNNNTSTADEFNFQGSYQALAAFNTTFPAGTYSISLTPNNGAAVKFPLKITDLAFPVVPKVTNYAACQTIAVGSPFVVKWNAFTGATTNDHIFINVRSASGNDYSFVETPGPGATDALAGSALSYTIPRIHCLRGWT